jgi:hypothetical protein
MLEFKPWKCEIISYHSGEDKDIILQGCDALSLGTWSPTLQKIVVPSSSRLELFNLEYLNLEDKTLKSLEHLPDGIASDSRRTDSSNFGCNVVELGQQVPPNR